MQIHELDQYDALGHFTPDAEQTLERISRRAPKPRPEAHRQTRSTSELQALAVPLEHSCPRLA